MKAILSSLVSAAFGLGCGFAPLELADEVPDQNDDLDGAVTINGIQVVPPVIHPGDEVQLHDPIDPQPGQRVPLYYWDACTGVLTQEVQYTRDAFWIAPAQPGRYSVTVNVTNAPRDQPSRVIPLCVAPVGADTCTDPDGDPPDLVSLVATPESQQCSAGCSATVDAETIGQDLIYRWSARQGRIEGEGASILWRLPAADCCPEQFSAALTVCGSLGGAAAGTVVVEILPE